MLKFGVSLWIILTIALFAFPIGRLAFFSFKKILKWSVSLVSKIYGVGALYRMKNKLLVQWSLDVENTKDDLNKKLNFDKNLPLFSADELFKWPHKLDKEGTIKKKKILEKIIYEALVLRKEWKLEEYEKKVIEWLAIQPDDKDLNKREAVDVMEKVVKLRPTVPSYLLTLADLYNELGDTDNAKKNYFRVLEYEPSNEKAKKKLKNLAAI